MTELTTKILALKECGVITNEEIVGMTSMQLFELAQRKTLGIAAAGGNVQTAYRTAYLEICKKHPVSPVDGAN